jgi:hypothetical protein
VARSGRIQMLLAGPSDAIAPPASSPVLRDHCTQTAILSLRTMYAN